jgi:PAS domain S-box-containing protein
MEEQTNILIVDDNRNNIYALSAILERPDYKIVAASSGKEALSHLLKTEFAVVLLDVMMPEMDGFAVATAMKAREKTRYIPIIFVTAVATELKQVFQGYQVGAVDYIQKPLEGAIVRAKVAIFVELFRKNKQIQKQAEIILNSERIHFLDKLQKAERKYRSLVNALDHAIIWEANLDLSSLSFVSERAEKLLGYRQEQWLEEPNFFFNHIPSEDHPVLLKTIESAIHDPQKNGMGERCEHRLIGLDQREHWFHTGIQVERDSGGKMVHLRGLSVDIDPLKGVEHALRDSEERLNLALRSAKMGIWDWNVISGSLIWSVTLKQIWGYKEGEFTGNIQAFWKAIHPDDHEMVKRAIAKAFEKDEDYQAEFRVIWPNGSEHWIYARGQAFRDLSHQVVRMSGIAIEISERKRIEEALKESEQRYRTVVEGVQDYAIARISPDGVIQDWNAGAERTFGYSKEEVLGKPLAVLFTKEEQLQKVPLKEMQDAFQLGSAKHERWHVRKDGSSIFVRGSLTAIRKDRKVIGYVKVSRDETQRKNSEEEREKLLNDLHQAVRSRDEVVSVVAHDLKNPLTSISLNTSVLLRRAKKNNDTAFLQQAEKIKRSVDRAFKFTDDILDLSKIEAGRYTISPRLESTYEIISEIVEMFLPIAEENTISLQKEVEPSLPPVYCDHEKLIQVFSNLIANALKFTQSNGEVRIHAKEVENVVQFSVSDNGPGIGSEDLFHLFDRYWQAGHPTKKGLGLGLYISKGIVEAHQGKIWVESKPGSGSTFYFTIPSVKSVEAA